ncbi:MAG TPA: hypothetical protein VIL13_09640 [Longimicrobiales bacterium]
MTACIDVTIRPGYHPTAHARFPVARVLALGALLGALGCTGTPAPQPVGPASPSVAEEAARAIAPDQPLRIVFDWTLQEREARFSGRGVARVEPPYRARLDLFGPRGDTYLSAAVVDDEVRLPPAAARAAAIPPPTLLWSALGVVRPPEGATLVATAQDGDRTRLEYVEGKDRWRFLLEGGRLRQAELDRAGAGRQTVELKGEAALGLPREAVYRDWAQYIELNLTLVEAGNVEPFPPEIWTLGAP